MGVFLARIFRYTTRIGSSVNDPKHIKSTTRLSLSQATWCNLDFDREESKDELNLLALKNLVGDTVEDVREEVIATPVTLS